MILLCIIHYSVINTTVTQRELQYGERKKSMARVSHEPTWEKPDTADSSLAAAQRTGGRGLTGWGLPVAGPQTVATGDGRPGTGGANLRRRGLCPGSRARHRHRRRLPPVL